MIRYLSLVVSVLLLISNTAFAGPGTTSAQILNFGGGARARALGDAFSAVSGDVTTSLWNPAGLANLTDSNWSSDRKGSQLSMFYSDRSAIFGEAGEGLYYTFFSGAMPLGDIGTIGATLQLNGQGTSAVTVDSPEVIRNENLGTNMVFTLSYADYLTNSIAMGINGKMIRMVLASISGSSYAVDLGLQYDVPFKPIPTTIGMVIQNVGPDIAFKDENQSDPLPRMFRVGTSMSLYRDKYNHFRLVSGITSNIHKLSENEEELLAHIESENAKRTEKITKEQLLSDRGVGIHAFEWRHLHKNVGIEYWLGNILAMRVGYKSEPGIDLPELIDHLTYGIGVKVNRFNLDIAYGQRFGPAQKRLLEVTGIIVF